MVENPANAESPLPAGKPHRRRWFRFGLFLLFVVAAAAAAIRVFAPATYTASALIRIGGPPTPLVSTDTHASFDLYKGTQIQLLTSDFVLIAALRRNTSQVEIVKQQEDPVRWLAKTLQVESPGNSEILRVSLSTAQRAESIAIVNAVVDAYQTEAVDKERAERANRLAKLSKVYEEKETELRSRCKELKALKAALGDGGQTVERMQPQDTDLRQRLAELRRAEMRAELRIAHLKHDLDGLDKESAKFKAAKAEAEAAEIDREFWTSKSTPLIEEIDALQKRLDRQAHESIDVEMMSGEIESAKKLVRALDDERQRAQVELNSQPRIVVVQRAQ
jgi:uncharacterized protein involved in exopolysaccharide biosynthesis